MESTGWFVIAGIFGTMTLLSLALADCSMWYIRICIASFFMCVSCVIGGFRAPDKMPVKTIEPDKMLVKQIVKQVISEMTTEQKYELISKIDR